LNDQQLDEVTAGVKDITITKHVDKASSSLLSSDGGCPGFEYWFQQLMF
jgi:hypothetical protein